jgi:hypothetical protein
MIRVITGEVGSGKTTELFSLIKAVASSLPEERLLLVTSEYTTAYAVHKLGDMPNLHITHDIWSQELSPLAPYLLDGKYDRIYIDGFIPSMKHLDIIDRMAMYGEVKEVVMTMQTNRDYPGLRTLIYTEGGLEEE